MLILPQRRNLIGPPASKLFKVGATSIKTSRASSAQTGFTHTHTAPAGLTSRCAQIILVAWIENAGATVTLTWGGSDIAGSYLNNLPVNTPGATTTPVMGVYVARNTSAGSVNLVVGNHTDMRCFASVVAWFECALFPLQDMLGVRDTNSTSRSNVPGTGGGNPPMYAVFRRRFRKCFLMSLAVGRGFQAGPADQDNTLVELNDAIAGAGTSSTTDMWVEYCEGWIDGAGNFPTRATFSGAGAPSRLGLLQVPVLGYS